MKFTELFEKDENFVYPKYSTSITDYIRGLIEGAETPEKPEEHTEAKKVSEKTEKVLQQNGKGMLYDAEDTEETEDTESTEENHETPEPENNYFLNDEQDEQDEPHNSEGTGSDITEDADSDELKDMVSDIPPEEVKNVSPEAQEIYNQLIDAIKDKDYEDTVGFVDDIVSDPKLKFLLSLGFGGDFSNTKLKLKKTNIPARRLIPTQSEIGTDETLKYVVAGNDVDVCFAKSTVIKKPIVTFQGTFVVDGHHRWSQIFVSNPDANIACIDISGNLSPISMLKAIQCTIGSNLGKLIHKNVKGRNLYDISEKDIRKYLEDNMSKTAIESFSKYYNDPIEALTKNAMELKKNNTPILNAPERGEMPQTSKDPELFNDLKKGVSDV